MSQSLAAGPPAIVLTQVVSGVVSPVDIQSARDGSGRLFIVEQPGRIRILQNGQLLATSYLDITAQVQFGGEQGLLGLAFDPGFKTNGNFFVYHTTTNNFSNVVARYTASPPTTNQVSLATRAEVIEISHPDFQNHNGGQLQFGPDGYLYIGTGDGGSGCDPSNNAQNLASLLGKLLRLDVHNLPYAIPADNPFVGLPVRQELWAFGLRNPWRFSFDRLTGDLLIGDVGQSALEEVDFQPANTPGGRNYGWRCFEGTLTNTCGLVCSNYPSVPPVLVYDHSPGHCAISGGYRYRGSQFQPLTGYYLYGDYCTGFIWAAQPDSNGVWTTTVLLETPLSISSFGEDEGGELYVADVTGGKVYAIIAPDADGDGLPDWFEQKYFGSPTAAQPGADPDGDGQTNLQEYQAGTNPLDPTDALRVTRIGTSGTDVHLRFRSVAAKRYRLEYAPLLPTVSWSVLTNNILGTGSDIDIPDPNATTLTNRFYRVVVTP